METQKVHLTKEKETLLATLYAKALDSLVQETILGDKFADEVVQKIDYDFKKLQIPEGTTISVPLRSRHLDQWTREFIAANPASTVLHLGCGLDSRVFRIDPPATVRWYDIDYPEVIELRKRLYPERHDYTLISSSVTDLRWLDGIPSDRPVLVVAEGLVYYLPEKEGIALFNRITEQFPHGEFIFDAFSRLLVRLSRMLTTIRVTGATLVWGIDEPRELENRIPRLHLDAEIPFLIMPELVSRLSPGRQKLSGILSRFKFYRRMTIHLRYRF